MSYANASYQKVHNHPETLLCCSKAYCFIVLILSNLIRLYTFKFAFTVLDMLDRHAFGLEGCFEIKINPRNT